MGWIGWRPTSHRLIARAWKDLSLGSRNRSCLDTYELLDSLAGCGSPKSVTIKTKAGRRYGETQTCDQSFRNGGGSDQRAGRLSVWGFNTTRGRAHRRAKTRLQLLQCASGEGGFPVPYSQRQ